MLNNLVDKFAFICLFLTVVCFDAAATEDVRKKVDNAIFDEDLRNACHQMLGLLQTSSVPGGDPELKKLPLKELNRTSRHIFLHGSRFRNLFGAREWEKVAPIIARIYGYCLNLISEENLTNENLTEVIDSLHSIHRYLVRLELEHDERGNKRAKDYWSDSDIYRPSSVAATNNERR